MNKFESGATTDEVEVAGLTEIEQLREPIRKLLSDIHEHIDSGEYKLLIGGDASGRIPALIFTKVIREVYKHKGFKVPRTLTTFIAGGEREGLPEEKRKEIVEHVKKHYAEENLATDVPLGGRVLIIEDTVASGKSIKPVTDALFSMGLRYDFVTIGDVTSYNGGITQAENRLRTKIHSAIEGVPKIYGKAGIAGVRKTKGDLFSEPNVTHGSLLAREDVDLVAKELTEWYLTKY